MKLDADDHSLPLRVVRAGRTRPVRGYAGGVMLTAAALHEAVRRGLFDGVPVFFRHMRDEARDLRDMAGVLTDAQFDWAAEAVVADAHPFSTQAGEALERLAADLRRHRTKGIPAPDVGVSLDAYFEFDHSGNLPVSRRLAELVSVDIVFRPAADGRILAEEDDVRHPISSSDSRNRMAAGSERITVISPAFTDGIGHGAPVSWQDAARIQGGTFMDADNKQNGEQENGTAWLQQLCTQATAATLAASGLPAPVQKRLAAAAYGTPEALGAAIEAARAELAELAAANIISIGSTPPRGRIGGMSTGLDQMANALDWIFGVRAATVPEPALRSVRTVYHTLTGDYDFYGRFEADRVLLEGATTATLANLAANAMNKVIVQQFSALTFWRWYEQIAYPTPNDGSV
jgi:hypothetical protein